SRGGSRRRACSDDEEPPSWGSTGDDRRGELARVIADRRATCRQTRYGETISLPTELEIVRVSRRLDAEPRIEPLQEAGCRADVACHHPELRDTVLAERLLRVVEHGGHLRIGGRTRRENAVHALPRGEHRWADRLVASRLECL